MLFDSHKDTASGRKLGLWQYFEFSGGKLGPENGPKPSTLDRPYFHSNT